MKYDPVKEKIGAFVNRKTWLRRLFYYLLDTLLLRTWHVKRAVRSFAAGYPGSARVLDAGSGFGQYSWRMIKMNPDWSIDAVDIKQEQVDDCNRFFAKAGYSGKVSFSYADLVSFTNRGTYNMILSVDVMEHIKEDRKVFKNFSDSLKEGGWLIISTPSDRGGSDVHHDHGQSFIDEHVRDGYGMDEITGKLKDAGFSEIDARYTYGKPGKISWKLSMKVPVTLLNTSWLFGIILPVWYLLVMPLALILNRIDTTMDHPEGTGLLVIARK